ncbi:MAG: Hsp20/alpha crystallin family protein [Flavobacteriales bacterium]|nr:Hsp20/alpha crystallin family protein [Flavobacteriales bacterium]
MTYLKELSFPVQFRPFSDMMDHFFGNIDHLQGRDDLPRAVPRVNIVEDAAGYKLEMQAPGFAKEDLKVNMENDLLTISAEHKTEELKEDERFTRREFSTRAFTRSFRLPELVQADAISAEYVNGVLKVSIPKKAEVKPPVRQIAIG